MDKILRSHQISTAIIDLIEESEEYCFIITPYYKPWPLLMRTLEKAKNQGKNIVFIFRADVQSQQCLEEITYLNSELDFDVLLIKNLHTKLYLNEYTVLLTSMNLYNTSKENNYEIGYLIKNSKISNNFHETVIRQDLLSIKPTLYLKGRYSRQLIKQKKEEELLKEERIQKRQEKYYNYQEDKNEEVTGFCIRCRERIPLSSYYTLCNSCFDTWAQFCNWNYPENYCHACGKSTETSKNQPFCEKCDKTIKIPDA